MENRPETCGYQHVRLWFSSRVCVNVSNVLYCTYYACNALMLVSQVLYSRSIGSGSFIFLSLESNRGTSSSVLASTMGGNSQSHQRTNITTAIMNSLHNEQVQQLKSDTVRNIWDITLSMNILYPDNWTKMTNEEVSNFQRFLLEKVITAVENATAQDYSYPWTFPRAFLFALTTLTTIGRFAS